jgi:hypothetical protein
MYGTTECAAKYINSKFIVIKLYITLPEIALLQLQLSEMESRQI